MVRRFVEARRRADVGHRRLRPGAGPALLGGRAPGARGGAPAWVTGAYDPALNTLYWGTGNPGPQMYGANRMGDNLYSDSLVAVDRDTGTPEVPLPVHAARRPRLGRHPYALPHRRDCCRYAQEAGGRGQSQRVLLH